MTVEDLIVKLSSYPKRLPVAYACCSEYTLLEAEQLRVVWLQPARPDGWVANDWSTRKSAQDKVIATVQYLVFPGN